MHEGDVKINRTLCSDNYIMPTSGINMIKCIMPKPIESYIRRRVFYNVLLAFSNIQYCGGLRAYIAVHFVFDAPPRNSCVEQVQLAA